MTNSTISTNNIATRFLKEVNREYVRGGIFGKYIGKTQNAVIQVKEDRKKISIPLIGKLEGKGVTGSTQLNGSEEALSNYAFELTPTYYRNGVTITNEENEKAEFQLFEEARPALMNWAMELKRDHIVAALGAVYSSGYKDYKDASASNMDSWNANNKDRILYGKATSNRINSNHTSSLASIDTTNDKLTAGSLSLVKRLAENADPLIRPIEIKDNSPCFVYFVGSYGFRDLQDDDKIAKANREARPREIMNNPIFTGGDLFYDGVIVKKVPEIDYFIDGVSSDTGFKANWGARATSRDGLDNGGSSASRIGSGFLCGAQAIGFGLGQKATFKNRREDDYQHQNGVAISLKHDIKKLFYNNKQHGMVTHFHSAKKDA